jgi:hypothetical protein
MAGRVSLMPRHELEALPPDDRAAVIALEAHLWWRVEKKAEHELLEQGDDGKRDCVFLTVSHMQRLLRQTGAPKRGEKYAAECLRALQRLGLLEDTGRVKLPRATPNRAQRTEGGRHAQPSTHRSCWWRVYRVPAVSRIFGPIAGAYGWNKGRFGDGRQGEASLSAFLVRQGLLPKGRRPNKGRKGSVQEAFWATGPP